MGDCKSLQKTEVAINGKNDYGKGHWQSIRKARLCKAFYPVASLLPLHGADTRRVGAGIGAHADATSGAAGFCG